MAGFADLLNKPLPSQGMGQNYMIESGEEDIDLSKEQQDAMKQAVENNKNLTDNNGTNGTAEEGGCADNENCDDNDDVEEDFDMDDDDVELDDIEINDEEDDFDPDDLSEDELAALDAELFNDDKFAGLLGDEDEVDLSPDEEVKADDMMSVAATTMLVNDELNAQEKADFVQNEAPIAVREGFMTPTDVNEMATSCNLEVAQEAAYTNKMIIRLDAASKKKQLYALAVNVSAAAHHDPDYIKLRKVMKMRKILRKKLEKKYTGEAMKRMKIYFARLKKSKSKKLSSVGNKLSK